MKTNQRFSIALLVSLIVHAGALGFLVTREFGNTTAVSDMSPRLRISLVNPLPELPRSPQWVTPPEPLEEVLVEPETQAQTGPEAISSQTPTAESLDEFDNPIMASEQAVASSNAGDRPDEDSAQSEDTNSGNTEQAGAEGITLSPGNLQRSTRRFLSTYGTSSQQRWLSECWQQRHREQEHDCNDPQLVTSRLEQARKQAAEDFRGLHRHDIQAAVMNTLNDELSVLAGLKAQGGVLGRAAANRMNHLSEQNAYLSGNYNDTYWNYLKNAFRDDPMVAFMAYQAKPRCGLGDCTFEYTPPGGTRHEPGFKTTQLRLDDPDAPFSQAAPEAFETSEKNSVSETTGVVPASAWQNQAQVQIPAQQAEPVSDELPVMTLFQSENSE